MKNTIRIFGAYLVSAILVLSFTSCSEKKMDEINADNGHTQNCDAKFIIPDIELRTAQNVVGGDFNTYLGSYVEYWVGTHNQLFNAELRSAEVRVSSTFNNPWGSVYENIRNAKIVIEKCSKGGAEEGNALALAIGQIMLAYNAAIATDLFGDTPYTQVGDFVTYPAPEADSQQKIYADIFSLLDDAIANLNGASNTVGQYDFIYGGDAKAWQKFAYGLKARYAMRLIQREDRSFDEILGYIGKSFSSAAEQASMFYDGSNQNPVFDFQWSRDGISSSTSMYNKLMAREDPRAERVYFDPNSWEHYAAADAKAHLAPNGEPEECQYVYCYDVHMFAEVAPVHFLSYHELLFLKAEAEYRSGKDAVAKATLKEAVTASFANLEVNVAGALTSPSINNYGGLEDISESALTDGDAEDYFDNNVSTFFDKDPFKEIMTQKYIALWGANGEGVETYADVRRLKAEGKDIYDFANKGAFPLRCPYGNDDVTSNPNIAKLYTDAGNYVFSENVWWAGGTR